MALDFTLASAHTVNYGDSDLFDPGTNKISFSAWVWSDNFVPAYSFINKRAAFNSQNAYTFGNNLTGGNRWDFQLGNAAGNGPGPTYHAPRTEAGATWHHVAYTYDGSLSAGSRAAIYVNGIALTVTVLTDGDVTPANTTADLVLARVNNTGSFYFDGRMAEAALWRVALSADDAVALYHGYVPSMVRARDLFFYDALRNSAARDTISGIAGTTSAAYIDHPRVITQGLPVSYLKVAGGGGGGGFQAAWARNSNVILGVAA